MKKFFQVLGIVTLLLVPFLYWLYSRISESNLISWILCRYRMLKHWLKVRNIHIFLV